jgi:phenylglyoxylate dehydrogenase beta subunit
MGRFRHLSPEQVEHIQKKVTENLRFVRKIAEQADEQ